jgi:hypothetical protein
MFVTELHVMHLKYQVHFIAKCLTTDWTTGQSRFDPRRRRKDFFSRLCVHTGSGAHPASCAMGTEGPFPGGKTRPGRDADHSLPSSAEVENEVGAILPLPQDPPWRVAGLLYFLCCDRDQHFSLRLIADFMPHIGIWVWPAPDMS